MIENDSNNEKYQKVYGYTNRILRVDLTKGNASTDHHDEAFLRKYIGGADLGIKYIFDEVPPDVEWDNPENRIFLGSGPLGGTVVGGSGGVAVVTRGALTNGMASTQANGNFGAFLRLSGFDAIILQGAAPGWVYLHVHDGTVEINDATHLLGLDTREVDHAIKEELKKKKKQTSILCIGPAGENLVRFAGISVDMGHMAAHNGVGAVMGSKRVKAIAVDHGTMEIPIKDKQGLSHNSRIIIDKIKSDERLSGALRDGTVGGVIGASKVGFAPVKNYTTSIHAIDAGKLEGYTAKNIREKFNAKKTPCWGCSSNHSQMLEFTEGKYAGRVMDEPEYEGMAAFSSLVGIDDVATTILLASEADRLGLDVNESGYLISWLMECYEKHILTEKDTDGLEMLWGNGEAVMAMLNKIAKREGFGDTLAEGVMRAAKHVGGQAVYFAVHTQKGNTPRGHDHRVMRFEQFDTCVSNVGTIEAHGFVPLEPLGLSGNYDPFDPVALPKMVADVKGAMLFDDSLVTCRFQSGGFVDLLCQVTNSATGWDMNVQEALTAGKRAVNLARIFNLRNGIKAELDAPSTRYGSTPLDGGAAGLGAIPQWNQMLSTYYQRMGWDEKGKPLPETLRNLDLEEVIMHLDRI